ncbi:MAG: 2OG-Fe(II) oxygenase [Nitrospirales bacterium]|nr:2OG-Fe(II) oxygenase [Nitrospirales bacterium]
MHIVRERVEQELNQAIQQSDFTQLQQRYTAQGEFLTIQNFFSPPVVDQLMEDVTQVRPQLNRNYIPTHKKGGSVSAYLLQQKAPAILAFYRAPVFIDWLSRLAGVPLLLCPDHDPHACALYFYTEPGDHIGFHYDTSYYKGARYTVLLGLVDRSTSQLVCRLHTKDPQREITELSLRTDPGSLVFFNGDRLYHAVTPLGEAEERIVLTLQYVTDPHMGTAKRWFSNMKDAVGYFGWSALFRRPT